VKYKLMNEWAENLFGTGEPEGLTRVAEMTWQVDSQDVTAPELAAYFADVYVIGGKYLKYKGHHLSAESAHQARRSYDEKTLKAVQDPHGFYAIAYASSAGWHLGDYMHAVGLHREALFEVLPINDVLLRNKELREAFLAGFRNQFTSLTITKSSIGNRCVTHALMMLSGCSVRRRRNKS
jgi:hypothetical protein